MAQEFVIKSDKLENKVNQLLPSQGGSGAGVDLSASTMVVPIVDLTESAEGGDARADLQTSLSLQTVTAFSVANTTSTLINTTGYFRIFGNVNCNTSNTLKDAYFALTDGVTIKKLIIFNALTITSGRFSQFEKFDFTVFLRAGESLTCLLYTSPSPRDRTRSRMPSSA